MAISSLQELSSIIGNPLEQEAARLNAAAEYSRTMKRLKNDSSQMAETIKIFHEHLKGPFLNVVEDSSEDPELRKTVLNLNIAFPLRNFARLTQEIREASKTPVLAFNMNWPDYAGAIRKEMNFSDILERVMKVAENPSEDEGVRNTSVVAFNMIHKYADTVFGQKIDREEFNERLIRIGETTSDPVLRKHALTMGY